jgi:quinol monooxygenase YgiN
LCVIAVIWEFEVESGKSEEFERFYGADGEWTKLSRRSRSFLGSSFLRDVAVETRYVLVEYWAEMVVYERHMTSFDEPVKELERQRDKFIKQLRPLGVFSALDVPSRAGPTWSRRSGV